MTRARNDMAAALVTRRRLLLAVCAVLALCSGAAAVSGPVWFPGFPLRTGTSVTLMWTPVPGATAYKVLRKAGDDGFREIYLGKATMFTDMAAAQEVTILYKVVAVMQGGDSEPSPVATMRGAEKQKPPVFTGAIATVDAITLRWSTGPGTAFSKIYRADAEEGPYRLHDSVRLNTYTDRDVVKGKFYYYRVAAVDAFNRESERSVSVRASLLSPAKAVDADRAVVRTPVPAGEFYGEQYYRLDQPADLGLAANGELYVLDRSSVQFFDADGKYLRRIPLAKGWGLAAGLTQDRDGQFLLPFYAERVVRKVDEEGQVVSEIRYPPYRKDRSDLPEIAGDAPATDNRMILPNNPNDVAVDRAGHYWIADGIRSQIIETDGSGKALRVLGQVPEARGGRKAKHPGEPEFPGLRRIYYNPIDGLLYAVLGTSAVIKVVDPGNGAVVRSFGGLGAKNGQFQSIGGLAFRGDGNILVLDPVMRVVKEFDKSLSYVATWADVVERDRIELSANLLTDIAYREDIRRIYLTSSLGNRVYKYDLPK